MSAIYEHLAELAPAGQLVGAAVRHLREPSGRGGDHRGLGRFWWGPADDLAELPGAWAAHCTSELLDQWRWVREACGGPARCASHRYLHGERLDGTAMLRLVTCARRPANGGGTLTELSTVLGLGVDLDIAERRPGDRRRYCPTMTTGRAFLDRYAPTVVLDTGGGLAAVWLFSRPAEPAAAKRLGADLATAFHWATRACGWAFDTPAPHAMWLKAPGCLDLFREHVTCDVTAGERWPFAELRAAVPAVPRRRWHRRAYAGEAL